MVGKLLIAAALSLAPSVAAATATKAEQGSAYSIARTRVMTVAAEDGHDYRVFVAWPETPPPPEGWPVLYVLDGEDNFAVVTQTLRRLSRSGERSGVEEGVVVAIESGSLVRRVSDYTPPTPGWAIPAGAPAAGLETGGAETFLDFISERVEPAVGDRWRIDRRRRMLLGHSFGGLLGLHAYFTRPQMFRAVAAISPSIWFGGDLLAREEAHYRSSARPPARLFVAAGTDERNPVGGEGAVVAGSKLVDRLASSEPSARTSFMTLPGQGHGATLLGALTPALRFTFERQEK